MAVFISTAYFILQVTLSDKMHKAALSFGMAIRDKVRQGRQDAGLKQREVAERMGVSIAAVGQWETGATEPSRENLYKLAEILDRPVEWFLGKPTKVAVSPPPAPQIAETALPEAALVQVKGVVQAGVWRHVEPEDLPASETVRVPLDRAFDGLRVYGLRVAGASMNLVYPPGTILICVKLMDLGREPRSGERVIVLRDRGGDGSELTVKEYRIDSDGKRRLYPKSSHPDFQEPVLLHEDAKNGEVIEVQSLVIASVKYEI